MGIDLNVTVLRSFKSKLILSYCLIIFAFLAFIILFLHEDLTKIFFQNNKPSFSLIRVAIALFYSLCLTFVVGSILAAETTKPINKIVQACRRFAVGDFSRKIFLSAKDEIGELADTLNRMAQDIEDKINEIKTQNQKFEAIFNSMVEGIIVVDGAGRIISINSTIEKIFSVSKYNTERKFFLEAIPNNDIADIIDDVFKRPQGTSREINLVWPISKVFQINASPIFKNNRIEGCLLVIHDITEIRRLENVRRDFVANVSHELKTPLTAIKGFVETLLGGALLDKENSRQFLEIIQSHAGRLDNLINDLLELSNIESEGVKLNLEELNLKEIVDKVLLIFSDRLNKKRVKVENNLSPFITVKVDKVRIEEVLMNLIDNSIKFNKENGFIKIYGQNLDNQVKITVEDSGVGIPHKDIPRIFERFYRVDKARSRELGGTGLGLSIVKHLIELHGGNVGIESTEGLGSKFWFILPT